MHGARSTIVGRWSCPASPSVKVTSSRCLAGLRFGGQVFRRILCGDWGNWFANEGAIRGQIMRGVLENRDVRLTFGPCMKNENLRGWKIVLALETTPLARVSKGLLIDHPLPQPSKVSTCVCHCVSDNKCAHLGIPTGRYRRPIARALQALPDLVDTVIYQTF